MGERSKHSLERGSGCRIKNIGFDDVTTPRSVCCCKVNRYWWHSGGRFLTLDLIRCYFDIRGSAEHSVRSNPFSSNKNLPEPERRAVLPDQKAALMTVGRERCAEAYIVQDEPTHRRAVWHDHSHS